MDAVRPTVRRGSCHLLEYLQLNRGTVEVYYATDAAHPDPSLDRTSLNTSGGTSFTLPGLPAGCIARVRGRRSRPYLHSPPRRELEAVLYRPCRHQYGVALDNPAEEARLARSEPGSSKLS